MIGDNVFELKPVLVALVSVDIAVIKLHLLRNRVAVVVAFCIIRNAVARGIVSRTRLRRPLVSTSVLQYSQVNSLATKTHYQLHSRGLPCIAYMLSKPVKDHPTILKCMCRAYQCVEMYIHILYGPAHMRNADLLLSYAQFRFSICVNTVYS